MPFALDLNLESPWRQRLPLLWVLTPNLCEISTRTTVAVVYWLSAKPFLHDLAHVQALKMNVPHEALISGSGVTNGMS